MLQIDREELGARFMKNTKNRERGGVHESDERR